MRLGKTGFLLAGLAAGAVAGLFGAGGGLVLVPALTLLTGIRDEAVFPTSLSVIAPICVVTLTVTALTVGVDWGSALPYAMGGAVGGVIAGKWGSKVPVLWLHRVLGALILWGGVRYLC